MFHAHLVLLYQRAEGVLVIRQAAVETQALFGLSQPLQQNVDGGVELLRLESGQGSWVAVRRDCKLRSFQVTSLDRLTVYVCLSE